RPRTGRIGNSVGNCSSDIEQIRAGTVPGTLPEFSGAQAAVDEQRPTFTVSDESPLPCEANVPAQNATPWSEGERKRPEAGSEPGGVGRSPSHRHEQGG